MSGVRLIYEDCNFDNFCTFVDEILIRNYVELRRILFVHLPIHFPEDDEQQVEIFEKEYKDFEQYCKQERA